MNTADLVSRARMRLLTSSKPSAAFLATGALRLQLVCTHELPTFAVDGTYLYYNPDFSAALTDDQREFVVAHEVLHCLLQHLFRRGSRDPELWNIACDHVVNLMLVSWGMKPPANIYMDRQYVGMCPEEVYVKLVAEAAKQLQKGSSGGSQPQNGQGKVGNQPQNGPGDAQRSKTGTQSGVPTPVLGNCPTGSFSDPQPQVKSSKDSASAASTKSVQQQAEDWAMTAQQAALAAKAAGTLPAELERLLGESCKPVTDWREEMREFVRREIPSSQSWSRPNRRFIGQGMYLPGDVKENFGTLVIWRDTSGSCWMLQEVFAAQIEEIVAEVRPEKTIVMDIDTRIAAYYEYDPDDTIVRGIRGGGGTRFKPAFDWLEEHFTEFNPVAAIYLTDMECGDKLEEPSIPVLWAVPRGCRYKASFGTMVEVDVV